MRIGIDVDDTIVDTITPMIKYADIYNEQVLGKNRIDDSLGKIHSAFYLEELYGWDRKTKFDFFDVYYKKVIEECSPLPNAVQAIQKLKQDGHEIYFVTARFSKINDCDSAQITKNTLIDNKIPFDNVIFDTDDKATSCKEHGIKIFIDDSFETCKKIAQNGGKAYLKSTIMNKSVENGQIERVNDWNEIYDKIQEYIKNN